ncbi:RagB/SusD family nutrient uptake outer membrane protein [Paramuribaculum intestinale]|uniref:RagB/SusD family nutrient uptake outer membrane protein n=2 Tax=Paramuribaculum intestinale TaxID=2094151 RepID=UPI0025AA184C|nr:RagB/SusD family nutrient uptake outer membrane protein [Paramuribaculum intestinale]
MKPLYKISLALTVVAAMQSCDLERTPLTSLSSDNFWDNSKNATLAMTAIYRGSITNGLEYSVSDFWSYQGLQFMDHMTDNAFDRRGENSPLFIFSSGKLQSNNAQLINFWSSAYGRIGRCNRFLDGIPAMADGPDKTRLTAEARFLRATQYHYLASYFKDVPLVTEPLTGEESNNVSKTPQAEILAWCANEFREAAADLPRFSEITGSESGRACRQAALAFAGRTYMLMGDWTNGSAVYKEIIDLGENAIHSSYSELFLSGTGNSNKENIFYIEYLENYFGWGHPQQCLSAKDGGWSLSNPAAGIFEEYEFADGTPFSYDDPRYNPDNLGENRDPRLDYTIYYNGATFKGTEYRMSPDYPASLKERIDYSSEASKTGFMWRKFYDDSDINDLTSYSVVVPVIRYAEVLLSYFECMLESGQPISQSLCDQTINAVRARADVGMPAITAGSADQMRQALRHERRVELVYEGIHYWDLLRWRVAHEMLTGEIWGAPYPNSELYATSTKVVDPTGNCRWYVGRRDFRNPQDYQWPIPLSEQNINPNLREDK